MSNSLLLKIAIEVVDLPINSIVDLSSSLWDSLPEGTFREISNSWVPSGCPWDATTIGGSSIVDVEHPQCGTRQALPHQNSSKNMTIHMIIYIYIYTMDLQSADLWIPYIPQ